MVIRDSVKVLKNFIDWLRYDVIDRQFPIKKISTLTTLTTMLWVKKWQKATRSEKEVMVNEMKKLQKEAEDQELLQNSRPIGIEGEDDEKFI